MVTVPAFLLRRLYVKGSLRNSDEGVQFQLMNKLGTGYAKRLLPLTLSTVRMFPLSSHIIPSTAKNAPSTRFPTPLPLPWT